MLKYLTFILFFLVTPLSLKSVQIKNDRIIWVGNSYAAFTSLEYYDGYFYCTFREAKHHGDLTGIDCGVIRLIRSKNGKSWELESTFEHKGHDFRDPQLCTTPDNKLMLSFEDVVYINKIAKYRKTVVSYKKNKGKMIPMSDLEFNPQLTWNWLWQPENVNHKICGFIYCPYFAFVQSNDGIIFNVGKKIKLSLMPTEASVTFFKNRYYTIVRTNRNAILGWSEDGEKWMWQELDQSIGCPKLFVYWENLLCVGRSQNGLSCITLYSVDWTNNQLQILYQSDVSIDCGYPGIVIHNNRLYMSYYIGDGKKSNIHFCEIEL